MLLVAVVAMAAFVMHGPTSGAAKSADQALPTVALTAFMSPSSHPSSHPCGTAVACHHAMACPAAIDPPRRMPGQEIAADSGGLAQDRTVGRLFVAGAALRTSWDRSVGLIIAVLAVARI
jgi:hypothetical protein